MPPIQSLIDGEKKWEGGPHACKKCKRIHLQHGKVKWNTSAKGIHNPRISCNINLDFEYEWVGEELRDWSCARDTDNTGASLSKSKTGTDGGAGN